MDSHQNMSTRVLTSWARSIPESKLQMLHLCQYDSIPASRPVEMFRKRQGHRSFLLQASTSQATLRLQPATVRDGIHEHPVPISIRPVVLFWMIRHKSILRTPGNSQGHFTDLGWMERIVPSRNVRSPIDSPPAGATRCSPKP